LEFLVLSCSCRESPRLSNLSAGKGTLSLNLFLIPLFLVFFLKSWWLILLAFFSSGALFSIDEISLDYFASVFFFTAFVGFSLFTKDIPSGVYF